MKLKSVLKWLAAIFILCVLITAIINSWVVHSTKSQLYQSIDKLPHRKTGLLLGTSKYLHTGVLNYYYQYRIDAAVALFRAGKIDYVLVSGDNSEAHYNEPETMKKDLIANGIPADRIYLDYAGFRTLDSILRCRDVFGQRSITIISQPFHNQRAVFIANRKDMDAIAFNAKDVNKYAGFKTQIREKLARVKMILDILFSKKAKFYGPKVTIP